VTYTQSDREVACAIPLRASRSSVATINQDRKAPSRKTGKKKKRKEKKIEIKRKFKQQQKNVQLDLLVYNHQNQELSFFPSSKTPKKKKYKIKFYKHFFFLHLYYIIHFVFSFFVRVMEINFRHRKFPFTRYRRNSFLSGANRRESITTTLTWSHYRVDEN
jgi:hypothetical protein